MKEAIEELEEAKKLDPEAPGVHYELSSIYKRQGDLNRAKEETDAFQQAQDRIEKARTFGLLRSQGDDFLQKGIAQDAANAYREAIKTNPRDPGVHYNLALALAKLGDKAGERRELEKAVELGPSMAEPHNRLGTIYLAEGKAREAQKEFESALALNPTLVDAMNNLGVLYEQMGNTQAALELFREAVRIQPQAAQARANLGLALAADGKFEEAERELSEAIRLDPENRPARSGLQMLKARRNQSGSTGQDPKPKFPF
jgi:Flp pilus assembly protein TadD